MDKPALRQSSLPGGARGYVPVLKQSSASPVELRAGTYPRTPLVAKLHRGCFPWRRKELTPLLGAGIEYGDNLEERGLT